MNKHAHAKRLRRKNPIRYPCITSVGALVGLSLLLSAGFRPDVIPPDRRLNVIFILADDLGWSDLGCYGNTFHETPNLDRLAASGVRFTQAYAACPVCSPTRASLMTGKYPARLGLTDFIPGRQARTDIPHPELLQPPAFRQALPKAEITLAELFKAHGYSTAIVGKWHLGNGPDYPTAHGFDVQIGTAPGGSPPSYFYPYQGPSNYVSNNRLDDLNATGKAGEYLTDRLTDEAIRFVETHRDISTAAQLNAARPGAARPFFLYLTHYAPHIPIQAKPELIEKYVAKKASRQAKHPVENPQYAALLHSLDEGVGKLMISLEQSGLAKNTVVVFMSDNGGLVTEEGRFTPATSGFPLRDGKGYLHEGGIRVPLLVRWPGRTVAGQQRSDVVCSTDFFPTFHDMLTGRLPRDPEVDGKSMLPVLGANRPARPRTLYWHYPHYPNQGARPGGAIRAGDWKLIEHYEDQSMELYNLKDDPGEIRNLTAQEPGRVARLRAKLHTWRGSVNAQMPRPNPNYQPPTQSPR